jgi:hypothetical protein
MKRNFMTLAAAVVAAGFLLTMGASRASADTVFDFTSCHVSGGCGTAPYGSVVLTQSGTSVNVVVTLESGAFFVKTGSGDNEAFKFIGCTGTGATACAGATSLTAADVTITSPTTPGLQVDFSNTSGLDGDGTGEFAFGISCPSCGMGGAGKFSGPIDFTVANATISDLEGLNSNGFNFVADVLLPNGNTGPIDASNSVPDGGMTLMLLGGVMVGFEVVRRKLSV